MPPPMELYKRVRRPKIVDLPDPDGPTKATVCPAGTVKLISLRIVRSGREG